MLLWQEHEVEGEFRRGDGVLPPVPLLLLLLLFSVAADNDVVQPGLEESGLVVREVQVGLRIVCTLYSSGQFRLCEFPWSGFSLTLK